MSYTLAAAAVATGLNKTTVLRAIKSGRISGTKDDTGQWHVEPVELHRVFAVTLVPQLDADAVLLAAADSVANHTAELMGDSRRDAQVIPLRA
jgi:hypothetical protein